MSNDTAESSAPASAPSADASAAAAAPPVDRFFVCKGKRIEIRDVWADTLDAELAIMRKLVTLNINTRRQLDVDGEELR